MPDKVRAHVIINGLVQGVFFRTNTKKVAEEHGVTGWVKNRLDSSVEAVFEGNKEEVDSVIKWCHYGPWGAQVEKVDIEWEEYKGGFNGFSIRY